jgi:hypothetical protein
VLTAPRPSLGPAHRHVLGAVQLARGLAALGGGRYADAFADLLRMFEPADPAYHPAVRCFAVGDLAEAAVRCGARRADANVRGRPIRRR